MPTTMALRFRDLVADTIPEHQALIQEKGYVWWGWWNKPEEKLPRNAFAAFLRTARQQGKLLIYLVDSGKNRLYTADLTDMRVSDIEDKIPCPEPDAVPLYYRQVRYKAWFKLTRIDKVEDGDIRQYSYDEVAEFLDDPAAPRFQDKRVFSVQEMLNRRHRTIYFLQPYQDHHQDHDLELLPTITPKNYIVAPIVTKSTYVLHISDPHFGLRHRFAVKGQELHKSLATLCIDDLRRTYDDLRFRTIQEANKAPLEIGMEVNVGLVQDDGVGVSKVEEM